MKSILYPTATSCQTLSQVLNAFAAVQLAEGGLSASEYEAVTCLEGWNLKRVTTGGDWTDDDRQEVDASCSVLTARLEAYEKRVQIERCKEALAGSTATLSKALTDFIGFWRNDPIRLDEDLMVVTYRNGWLKELETELTKLQSATQEVESYSQDHTFWGVESQQRSLGQRGRAKQLRLALKNRRPLDG